MPCRWCRMVMRGDRCDTQNAACAYSVLLGLDERVVLESAIGLVRNDLRFVTSKHLEDIEDYRVIGGCDEKVLYLRLAFRVELGLTACCIYHSTGLQALQLSIGKVDVLNDVNNGLGLYSGGPEVDSLPAAHTVVMFQYVNGKWVVCLVTQFTELLSAARLDAIQNI
ncbi:hypothetical protein AKJ16_DCAP14510 [Drosera capensis]